jgi:hypothetical protein
MFLWVVALGRTGIEVAIGRMTASMSPRAKADSSAAPDLNAVVFMEPESRLNLEATL